MVLHIAKVFIIIVSLEIPDLQKSSQIGLSFWELGMRNIT